VNGIVADTGIGLSGRSARVFASIERRLVPRGQRRELNGADVWWTGSGIVFQECRTRAGPIVDNISDGLWHDIHVPISSGPLKKVDRLPAALELDEADFRTPPEPQK
jgi:hypothetical protein